MSAKTQRQQKSRRQERTLRAVAVRTLLLGSVIGLVPWACYPPPGPCLGLKIGDELVMTIEETAPNALPCDYEAFGFLVGKNLRLSVDEHLFNGNGERVYCSISTGQFLGDTGWTYEETSRASNINGEEDYAAVVKASNGECEGYLDLRLRTGGTAELGAEPIPARISISYESARTGAGCPVDCRGGLLGPVARTGG
jgi:hypothetical protein